MMVMSCVCLVILVAAAISLSVRERIEKTLPMAAFLILLELFLMAVCGVMGTVIYIILWGTAIVFCCGIGLHVRKERNTTRYRELIATPGLLIFIVMAVFLWWFSAKCDPTQWDEFSHWAITVKDMFYRDRLSTDAAAVTSFRSYPPAMALWQYFFVRGKQTFSAGHLYYAYNLFLLLMMMPLFQRTQWKRPISSLALTAVAFMMPYLLYTRWEGVAWSCLYIDRALAFCFAYALCSYFLEEKKTWFVYIRTGCALAVLGLLKSTGNFTAAIVAVMVALDGVQDRGKGKHTIRNCLMMLVPWLFALAAWKLHLTMMGVLGHWNTKGITIEAILKLVTGRDAAWKYEFTSLFIQNLIKPSTWLPGVITVSFAAQPLVWLALMLLAEWITPLQSGGERESGNAR